MDGFVVFLEERRKHYRALLDQSRSPRYTPPHNLAPLFNPMHLHTSDLPSQRNQLIKPLETYAQDFAYTEASNIEAKIANIVLPFRNMQISSSTTKTLNSAMRRLRKQATRENLKKIDSIYEAAKDLGAAHPNVEGDILNVTDQIGEYLVEFFNKIAFVVPLVTDAITWIADMAELIKHIFCAIRDWIGSWFLEPGTL